MENTRLTAELEALPFINERIKQIEKYGFTVEHAKEHPEWYDKNQMLYAAQQLLNEDKDFISTVPPVNWQREWWERMRNKDFKERIEISGTLVIAHYAYIF